MVWTLMNSLLQRLFKSSVRLAKALIKRVSADNLWILLIAGYLAFRAWFQEPDLFLFLASFSFYWLWVALLGVGSLLKQHCGVNIIVVQCNHGSPEVELSVKQQETSNDD